MICQGCGKSNVNRECWDCGELNNDKTASVNIVNKWEIARKIMENWKISPRELASFDVAILDDIRSAIAAAYVLGKAHTEFKKQGTTDIPVQTSVTISVEKMLEDIRQHHSKYITPIFQKVLQGTSTETEKIKLFNVLNLLQVMGKKGLTSAERMSQYNTIGSQWVGLISDTFFKNNPDVNQVLMSILNDGKSEIVWVCNNVKIRD